MRYHNITKDDMLNGDGLRVVLWVAGCAHHCKGCQNPITWNSDGGLLFDDEAKGELFKELSKGYVSGVTFSGGDPLYPGNRKEVLELAGGIKKAFPEKTIWVYTGYLWNEVKDLPGMKYVDVLVDGEYKESLRDVQYHWAGSTNQKVIDVQESLRRGSEVLHGVQKQGRTPEGGKTGAESK